MRRLLCLLLLPLFLLGCPEPAPETMAPPPPPPPAAKGAVGEAPAGQPTGEPEGLTTSPEAMEGIKLQGETLDPVCKMAVDPLNAKASWVWGDTSYSFCNTHCMEAFKKNPKKFVEQ